MGTQDADSYISSVISVCCSRDLQIWKKTANHLLSFVKAVNYEVIVPDAEVTEFVNVTPKQFLVIPESQYIDEHLKACLNKRLLPSRIGWYLQQFIKISAMRKKKGIVLLWDADTVPLKPLKFIDDLGRMMYYKSNEYYRTYFDLIRTVLKLEKKVDFSFIAQCFVAQSDWVREFCRQIELRYNKDWWEGVIDSIGPDQQAGFSEYETLGTFFTHNYPDKIVFIDNKWTRHGTALVDGIDNLTEKKLARLANRYDFAAFEMSEKPNLRRKIKYWIRDCF